MTTHAAPRTTASRGSGWQVATALACVGYTITSLGACLTLLARDLRLPVDRLAGLSAMFGVGLVVVAAVGPALLRRGPHHTLRGGAAVAAVGGGLLATAATLPVAAGGVLLLGFGCAALVLAAPVLLAGPDAAARLTRVNAAASGAAVVAPATIGALDSTGVDGRLALLAAVPPLLALAGTGSRTAAPAPPRPGGARPRPARVLRNWSSVVLAVAVEFCFTIWAVARLLDTGLPTAAAALLASAFPVGMAVGRLYGPALLARLPVVTVGGALTVTGAVAVAASGHPAVVTAALTVAGAGVATLYPVTLAGLVGTDHLSPHHASSLGALASGVAILVAPTALAAVASVTGLRVAFLLTLPMAVALIALQPRRSGRRQADPAPVDAAVHRPPQRHQGAEPGVPTRSG